MTRIVSYPHRHKRPPGRQSKAAAVETPEISRAGKLDGVSVRTDTDRAPAASSFNGTRKSAIVTARKPRVRVSTAAPDPEEEAEHNRRADAADALFRDIVRKLAEA